MEVLGHLPRHCCQGAIQGLRMGSQSHLQICFTGFIQLLLLLLLFYIWISEQQLKPGSSWNTKRYDDTDMHPPMAIVAAPAGGTRSRAVLHLWSPPLHFHLFYQGGSGERQYLSPWLVSGQGLLTQRLHCWVLYKSLMQNWSLGVWHMPSQSLLGVTDLGIGRGAGCTERTGGRQKFTFRSHKYFLSAHRVTSTVLNVSQQRITYPLLEHLHEQGTHYLVKHLFPFIGI